MSNRTGIRIDFRCTVKEFGSGGKREPSGQHHRADRRALTSHDSSPWIRRHIRIVREECGTLSISLRIPWALPPCEAFWKGKGVPCDLDMRSVCSGK